MPHLLLPMIRGARPPARGQLTIISARGSGGLIRPFVQGGPVSDAYTVQPEATLSGRASCLPEVDSTGKIPGWSGRKRGLRMPL